MQAIKEVLLTPSKYSLESIRRICDELDRAEESLVATGADAAPQQKRLSAVAACLRQLTKALVWSDKHSEERFEQIMERDTMNTLERLATNAATPPMIKLQVLQCVTMLMQNLTRVSSIYFLCSNNHINRMVALEFDQGDDDFVSHYVSFLKTLALRFNKDTVQFFFDATNGAFPLFEKAMRLFNSDDAMVRTAARQVVLTITQIEEKALANFLAAALPDVLSSVFHFMNVRVTEFSLLVPFWGHPKPLFTGHEVRPVRLTAELNEVDDDILYLNDLCHTPTPQLAHLVNTALNQTIWKTWRCLLCSELSLDGTAEREEHPAGSRAASPPSPPSSSPLTASVLLAVLLRWARVNTVPAIWDAMLDLLLGCSSPGQEDLLEALFPGATSVAAEPEKSLASLIFTSARVDLFESLAELLLLLTQRQRETVLYRGATTTASAAHSMDVLRLAKVRTRPRLATSLTQFFYVATPFQQSGTNAIGGPASKRLPELSSFLAKIQTPFPPIDPFDRKKARMPPLSPHQLLPALLTAIYQQIKYFHVTRMRGFWMTLRLLQAYVLNLENLCRDSQWWEVLYVEVMKLIQRQLLEYLVRCVSAFQADERAVAAGEHPTHISRITFEDLKDDIESGAPLPIRDPYSMMFLKMKAAAVRFDRYEEKIVQPCNLKDLHFFFPAFPCAKEGDDGKLIPNGWPPCIVPQSPSAVSLSTEGDAWVVYLKAQKMVVDNFPLPHRSATSPQEAEECLYLLFLTTRYFFATQWNTFDTGESSTDVVGKIYDEVLCQVLRRVSPSPVDSHFTTRADGIVLQVRCEITMEWCQGARGSPIATLGSPLQLVVTAYPDHPPTLQLQACHLPLQEHRVRRNDPCHPMKSSADLPIERLVLCSLDLAYVSIVAHPELPFKAILAYHFPLEVMVLHLVFQDKEAASQVVIKVENLAREYRERGGSLCFGLMNYKSALVDY